MKLRKISFAAIAACALVISSCSPNSPFAIDGNDTTEYSGANSRAVMAPKVISRVETINRAKAMINVTWTPKSDLVGWSSSLGKSLYKANTVYTGLPYTQTTLKRKQQSNGTEFLAALANKTDFYTTLTNSSGTKMSSYGNDCSGFSCKSWELYASDGEVYTTDDFYWALTDNTNMPSNTVQPVKPIKLGVWPDLTTMTTTKYNQLKAGYALMKPGDAFLSYNEDTNHGHMFILISATTTTPRTYTCAEQFSNRGLAGSTATTPSTVSVCRVTTWTEDQLCGKTPKANTSYTPFEAFTLNVLQ